MIKIHPKIKALIILVIFFFSSIFYYGCSGSEEAFNDNDIKIIQNIYKNNDWEFQESDINISVHTGGAITVSIVGEAIKKNEVKSEFIWLPVALMSDLPKLYKFEGEQILGSELIAYKSKDGFWSIVASIPIVTPVNKEEGKTTSLNSKKINIDILMVSSKFSNKIPIQFPINQNQSVPLSIELPKGSKFTSLKLKEKNLLEYQSDELSLLPAEKSNEKVKASILLKPELSNIWDLSKVKFKLTGSKSLSKILVIIGLSLLMITIFIWFFVELKHRELSKRYEIRFSQSRDLDRDLDRELDSELDREIYRTHGFIDKFIGGNIFRIIDRYRDAEYYLERNRARDRYLDEDEYEYRDLIKRLLAIRKTKQYIIFYIITTTLVSLIILVLLISSAIGAPSNDVILGDLRLNIERISSSSDEVGINIDFYALSSKNKENNQSKLFVIVGENDLIINKVNKVPKDLVKVIQNSPQKTTIDVPINVSPNLSFIDAILDPYVEVIRVPNSYKNVINKSQFVKLEYEVNNVINKQISNSNGWFFWFPFDRADFEIPLVLSESAALKNIEVGKISKLPGNISISGIEAYLKLKDKKHRLKIKPGRRLNIPAGTKIYIKGKFQRSLLTRFCLTIGLLLASILGGIALGLLAALPDNKALALFIQGLGIVGLPSTVRSGVFSANPELPSIFSANGTSIFEISFMISSFILLYVGIRTWMIKKNIKPDWWPRLLP